MSAVATCAIALIALLCASSLRGSDVVNSLEQDGAASAATPELQELALLGICRPVLLHQPLTCCLNNRVRTKKSRS